MKITKEMLKNKLKEVKEFEAKWGECTSSRAMKKYCTDKKYRQRVHAFNKSIIESSKYYGQRRIR